MKLKRGENHEMNQIFLSNYSEAQFGLYCSSAQKLSNKLISGFSVIWLKSAASRASIYSLRHHIDTHHFSGTAPHPTSVPLLVLSWAAGMFTLPSCLTPVETLRFGSCVALPFCADSSSVPRRSVLLFWPSFKGLNCAYRTFPLFFSF